MDAIGEDLFGSLSRVAPSPPQALPRVVDSNQVWTSGRADGDWSVVKAWLDSPMRSSVRLWWGCRFPSEAGPLPEMDHAVVLEEPHVNDERSRMTVLKAAPQVAVRRSARWPIRHGDRLDRHDAALGGPDVPVSPVSMSSNACMAAYRCRPPRRGHLVGAPRVGTGFVVGLKRKACTTKRGPGRLVGGICGPGAGVGGGGGAGSGSGAGSGVVGSVGSGGIGGSSPIGGLANAIVAGNTPARTSTPTPMSRRVRLLVVLDTGSPWGHARSGVTT